jgi:hypothetical protein
MGLKSESGRRKKEELKRGKGDDDPGENGWRHSLSLNHINSTNDIQQLAPSQALFLLLLPIMTIKNDDPLLSSFKIFLTLSHGFLSPVAALASERIDKTATMQSSEFVHPGYFNDGWLHCIV